MYLLSGMKFFSTSDNGIKLYPTIPQLLPQPDNLDPNTIKSKITSLSGDESLIKINTDSEIKEAHFVITIPDKDEVTVDQINLVSLVENGSYDKKLTLENYKKVRDIVEGKTPSKSRVGLWVALSLIGVTLIGLGVYAGVCESQGDVNGCQPWEAFKSLF